MVSSFALSLIDILVLYSNFAKEEKEIHLFYMNIKPNMIDIKVGFQD